MTDHACLERRYRWLLACYPRAFRVKHEDEMLTVLLACAPEGHRWPGAAETANLLVNALHIRLRAMRPRASAASWAVRLMVLAAALELVAAGTVLATRGALSRAIARHDPRLTSAQITTLVNAHTTPVLIGALIAAVAWLLLARANARGRRWARAAAVALGVLTSLGLLQGVGEHAAVLALADVVAGTVLWAVALVATGLIISPYADRRYRAPRGSLPLAR